VHLGFTREVAPGALAAWVAAQDAAAMLGALNALPVAPGDALLVPAGVPHAIGEGVFLVELQEPTDFSVLLEWEGFAVDGASDGHLGLGFDVALGCVDRSGWDRQRLAGLRGPAGDGRGGRERLLPAAADPFFRAERLLPAGGPVRVEPSFAILVVVGGEGRLDTEAGGPLALARGDTVLVPFGAGAAAVSGAVDVIRCLPPDPLGARP
jgi:mannose-6-phosphate isomerase